MTVSPSLKGLTQWAWIEFLGSLKLFLAMCLLWAFICAFKCLNFHKLLIPVPSAVPVAPLLPHHVCLLYCRITVAVTCTELSSFSLVSNYAAMTISTLSYVREESVPWVVTRGLRTVCLVSFLFVSQEMIRVWYVSSPLCCSSQVGGEAWAWKKITLSYLFWWSSIFIRHWTGCWSFLSGV